MSKKNPKKRDVKPLAHVPAGPWQVALEAVIVAGEVAYMHGLSDLVINLQRLWS